MFIGLLTMVNKGYKKPTIATLLDFWRN